MNPIKLTIPFIIAGLLCFSTQLTAGDTKEFVADGIKVILKPSTKEVISVRFFVEGGTTNYPESKEGIEALTLGLMVNGGTKNLPKIEFNTAAEQIGTEFSSSTTYDYGNIHMNCISRFWNESWNLFADAIMNPALDVKEFKIVKEQSITAAKSNQSDPDGHLRNLAMDNAFKGSSYAKIPDGSPEALESVTLADVQSYYKKIIGKRRVFLVVVGKVTEEDLREKIRNSLAKLPYGSPAVAEKRQLIKKGGVFVEDRDIATNYIRGVMSAPLMSEDDGVPMRIAMSILRDRYFVELRTKRSLSYAPAAFYSSGVLKNPYNVIYISTLHPDTSMQVMVDEINSIKSKGFDKSELVNTQQTFLTEYYMGQETNASQSLTLGTSEIIENWTLVEEFTERVNNVTLNELNKVFDKYTGAIQWTYLGKQDQVEQDHFKQTKPAENKPY